MSDEQALVPVERIEAVIHVFRGERVMLDSDIAVLYGVETRIVGRAVARHPERFPTDFMFQLTNEEFRRLRSQFGISNTRGGRRYLPYVFTEHGVAMLSSVLNSPRAIEVNIEIMRAFVRLRHATTSTEALSRRVDALEQQYDGQFQMVFEAIDQLMAPPPHQPEKRKLGFREDQAVYGRER